MNSTCQQTMEFQAEVKQLLDIVINSLYTDREIFLRELISNAADALEKLRYIKLTNEKVIDKDLPLEISIELDEKENKLSIYDSGIGMTREELVENLGTIAHSGSKAFLKHLAESDGKDINLIGQFGVGFYSAFMVAEKVVLVTRSYQPEAEGCRWVSEGTGSFSVSEEKELPRGTKITLHLKDDADEFSKAENIKRIIKQYSSFVPFPIKVNGEKVNTVQAIWTKNKSEVTEEQYKEFYKYIANAYDEPLFRLHFTTDAPLSIKALLFVPSDNYERFGFGRMEPGVNLYCKKVLIQQQSEDILPQWLRFVRGVVDSEELPLNISRENMQDSALVSKIRRVITKRFVKFLNEQAQKEPEKYKEFWEKFSMFIKEGAAADYTYRDELVKLLRFESSKTEPGSLTSLKEYVERMKDDQKAIYYINGPSRKAIESGPYLEVFRQKDIEVLYTQEAVDDYILSQLGEFEGKKLISADQENLELAGDVQKKEDSLPEERIKSLSEWLKKTLGDKVSEVKVSNRLVDSPAVVISPGHTSISMERMMQLVNNDLNNISPKILEINPGHAIIKRLADLIESDEELAKMAAEQIFDNALLSAGLVIDPRDMIQRMYQILEKALEK